MKEKKITFVNSVEDKIGLQRKKTRACENSDVENCLYKWFLQEPSEGAPVNGVIFKAQAG
jgi:hypothetical protein